MGGIRDELRLTLKLHAQAFGEVIERPHQRAQLTLDFHQRQRPKIVGLALFDRSTQTLQRAQRGTDGEPYQHQRAHAEHAQTQ